MAVSLDQIESLMIGGQWQKVKPGTVALHDTKGPMWEVPTVTFFCRQPASAGLVECPLYLVEGVRYASNTDKE